MFGTESWLRRIAVLLWALAILLVGGVASAQKLQVYTEPIEPFAFDHVHS